MARLIIFPCSSCKPYTARVSVFFAPPICTVLEHKSTKMSGSLFLHRICVVQFTETTVGIMTTVMDDTAVAKRCPEHIRQLCETGRAKFLWRTIDPRSLIDAALGHSCYSAQRLSISLQCAFRQGRVATGSGSSAPQNLSAVLVCRVPRSSRPTRQSGGR